MNTAARSNGPTVQQQGRNSEDRAVQYLIHKNWRILARRQKIARVEVDILAEDSTGLLHVVEVKSAGSARVGYVSVAQQRRLARAAQALAGTRPVEILLLVMQEPVLEIPILPGS